MAARTQFYLDKADGKLSGVCAGVSDYTGINVTVVRIALVLAVVNTGGTFLIAYALIAWLANDRPQGLYETPENAKFWQGVRSNPKRSTAEVRSSFRELDRRLADLETLYTSRNSQLASEIESLR